MTIEYPEGTSPSAIHAAFHDQPVNEIGARAQVQELIPRRMQRLLLGTAGIENDISGGLVYNAGAQVANVLESFY